MNAHLDRVREEVEGNAWRAARTTVLLALGLTFLAVGLGSVFQSAFMPLAFFALVAWFVGLALVVMASRETLVEPRDAP